MYVFAVRDPLYPSGRKPWMIHGESDEGTKDKTT